MVRRFTRRVALVIAFLMPAAFAQAIDHTVSESGTDDSTTGPTRALMDDHDAYEFDVVLGRSGETVTIVRAEDGSYRVNGEVVSPGTTVVATNGSIYTLVVGVDEAGKLVWTASHEAATETVALGMSGDTALIMKREDGTYWLDDDAVVSGERTTKAGNGNRYTLTRSEEGTWSATYVPAVTTVTVGTRDVLPPLPATQAEDGTWTAVHPVTGESIVLEEGGIVMASGHAYTLSSDDAGMWNASFVPVRKRVRLGASGTTIMLAMMEDGTWWYESEPVTDGAAAMAANGNPYILRLEDDGTWTAMYDTSDRIETLQLGSSGTSVSVRWEEDGTYSYTMRDDERMPLETGMTLESATGNAYRLVLDDGVWSAAYVPVTREIQGTGGLIAVAREDGTGYDVGGSILSADGTGRIDEDGAKYHVKMVDGMLVGTRFEEPIDTHTHFQTNGLSEPAISRDDPSTVESENGTHFTITGDVDVGEGTFPIGDLLGTGLASSEGVRFVDEAVETITKARSDVEILLSLDVEDQYLQQQWRKITGVLDTIFVTDSDAVSVSERSSAVSLTAPRKGRILDEIDEILDALSSEDAFVEATREEGDGPFANQRLKATTARSAFDRVKWAAVATMSATGSTRYGAAIRESTEHAQDELKTTEYGAYSYSTMDETLRTSNVVAPAGVANYAGGTEAISRAGTTYSGRMELQLRFATEVVSAVIKDLVDSNGRAWQYSFADVDTIVLDDATLLTNGRWRNRSGTNAVLHYATDSDLLRPTGGIRNTFEGQLLGRGADAGSEASGAWSVGNATASSIYLTGGFGVQRTDDDSRSGLDSSGSAPNAVLISTPLDDRDLYEVTGVDIKDGKLAVRLPKYGWNRSTISTATRQSNPGAVTASTYGLLTAEDGEPPPSITAEFDLATLVTEGPMGATSVSGPKHVDQLIDTLLTQRKRLTALQDLEPLNEATMAVAKDAWEIAVHAVVTQLFGDLRTAGQRRAWDNLLVGPYELAGDYASDTRLQEGALDLIDQVLVALSSSENLHAALYPDGIGIFDHYDKDITTTEIEEGDFIWSDRATIPRWRTIVRTFPVSETLAVREYEVFARIGTTNYTRFGAWRRQSSQSAFRTPDRIVAGGHGGPGAFGYSPLAPTRADSDPKAKFLGGGSARYSGKTVAIMRSYDLAGEVTVDVSWDANPDITAGGSRVGTMSLAISNLVDITGRGIGFGADRTSPSDRIDTIVLRGLEIKKGMPGANSGHLIVGDQGTPTAGRYDYGEIPVSAPNVWYRFASVTAANTGRSTHSSSSSSAMALFVGHGVEGPLGVIGTWTLKDPNVGRIHANGTILQGMGLEIRGAFGADLP